MRMILAIAITFVFIVQARKAPIRSSRQFAFLSGATAFAIFALSNGLTALGVGAQIVQVLSMFGIALIGVSLLMMVRAYTSGEMRDRLRRASEMVAEERARTKDRSH